MTTDKLFRSGIFCVCVTALCVFKTECNNRKYAQRIYFPLFCSLVVTKPLSHRAGILLCTLNAFMTSVYSFGVLSRNFHSQKHTLTHPEECKSGISLGRKREPISIYQITCWWFSDERNKKLIVVNTASVERERKYAHARPSKIDRKFVKVQGTSGICRNLSPNDQRERIKSILCGRSSLTESLWCCVKKQSI